MMRSLYSGVAGLRTHQTKMDVIGNNIANVNTVAFKATQTTFSDVMYQNMSNATAPTDTLGGVNAKQIGLGALTAATKTTIENSGASQDTGEAFDIRLTDGQSTNFFIVDDGTGQKLFTRAGSFFIDGAGSLAMTSTGYIVQGWQAVTDAETGETYINKDTVTPLRLNTPENQTSNPEATQEGYVSGILDKNDTAINSDSGYNMSFGFYDNKGNMYTAKFAVKTFDPDGETYTIQLKNIYDENNNDILRWYVNKELKAAEDAATTSTDISSLINNGNIVYNDGTTDHTVSIDDFNQNPQNYLIKDATDPDNPTYKFDFGDGTVVNASTLSASLTDAAITSALQGNEISANSVKIDAINGTLDLKSKVTLTEDDVISSIFGNVNEFGKSSGAAKNTYPLTSKYGLDDRNNISVSLKVTKTVTDDSTTPPTVTTTKVSASYSVDPYKINESPEKYIVFSPKVYDTDGTTVLSGDDKYHLLGLSLSSEDVAAGISPSPLKLDTDPAAPTIEAVFGANSSKIIDLIATKDDSGNITDYGISGATIRINPKDGALEVTYQESSYYLDFDEANGDFSYVGAQGDEGNTVVSFNMSLLSDEQYDVAFDDIDMDFSKLKSLNNGGSAAAGADRGNVDQPTVHAGKAIGKLIGLSVSNNGEIYGSYSNGNSMLLAQIAVAQFANASGLEELGSNLYAETLNSGHFDGIGVDITNDGGKMNTGSLEMSNVDLSREFTEMITTQRGFQANSRIITVSDTLLEELTNLKR